MKSNKTGKIEFTENKANNSDAKLLAAIVSLNNVLDKNFKTLSNALKESSKSKAKNIDNDIKKIKLEKEKASAIYQLKMQKLQEKNLEQRVQYAKELYKQASNNKTNSTSSLISAPSRIYNNIKSQGSNAGSALALSLMTGGIINPVIAKEFGLDKIITATTKFGGRVVGKIADTAWNMTGGLAWNNLKQPFTNPNSQLRLGISKGNTKISNMFSNPFSKDDDLDGKQAGAIAKDKDKLAKIEKNTQDMVNLLSKPKDQIKTEEKEKKKSLLDKIFEAIGGMGLILKGAAVAAIPYVIKEFLPKATAWLDEKFKGFLTGTVGLSKGGAEVASQLVKDALPGALFGLTVGGIKGAIVGGILGIIGNKLGQWTANITNWLTEKGVDPTKAFFTALGLEGITLAGSIIGIKKGLGALGIGISKAGNIISDTATSVANKAKSSLISKLGDAGKALKDFSIKIGSVALDLTKKTGKFVISNLKTVGGALSKLGGAALRMAGPLALYAGALSAGYGLGKLLGLDDENSYLGSKVAKAGEWVGDKAHSIYKWWKGDEGDISKLSPEELNKIRATNGLKLDENKKDLNGGGYGTLGNISNNGILHGTKVTGLKDMGLKGSVVSSNSIPYIASQNEQSLKTLDQTLSDWGYEVVYTSAMGGHRAYTGHWKGNKVDLQLKKNGKPTHLSSRQLNMLGQAGYWGRGTGALGWEPVSGQVGGGHYDLFIGSSNSGTVLASAANIKLPTNDMPTSQETQVFAMNDMAETTQANAENIANSNDSILGMLDNMNTNIASSNSIGRIGNIGQAIDISIPSTPGISVSSNTTQGGGGSQTGNVYAFGDVAKTPILYTL